jgi:ubiquinone biosynthesis monooxygenase Coq7
MIDTIIKHIELARKTLWVKPSSHERAYPAEATQEKSLSEQDKKHIAGLMRVNHAGEVCAQALYQGQALTARSASIKEKMQSAAHEELDHLAWCNRRLQEVDSHSSYLDALWYIGALSIGIAAGAFGDRWSLAFLAETENQVAAHLESHMTKLPIDDEKSRRIIEQMHQDETKHRNMAIDNGAAELPAVIKQLMRLSARVMTTVAYKL